MNKHNTDSNVYIFSPHGDVHIHFGNTAEGIVEEYRHDATSDENTGYHSRDDSQEHGIFNIQNIKLMSELARCCYEVVPSLHEWTCDYFHSASMAIKVAFQDNDFRDIVYEALYGFFNQ